MKLNFTDVKKLTIDNSRLTEFLIQKIPDIHQHGI
jgi:hypothetical protein